MSRSLLDQTYMEPFIKKNGELGLIIPEWDPSDCIKSFREWGEFDKNRFKGLEEEWTKKINNLIWPLPGEPDISKDDPGLMDDIINYIWGFVEFPNEKLYPVFASWIICTYIIEWLDFSPRIIVVAPTEHGKGRVLKMAKFLSFRGSYLGDPSSAVIYRLTSWDNATILIDEFQDIKPDETRGKLLTTFKLGFDVGTVVPRMNNDNSDYDNFRTYSFWLIASKNLNYPEDVINRSIYINMRKRTRELRPEPKDDEEVRSLRTRLLAFRIRLHLGLVDLEPIKSRVEQFLKEDYNKKTGNVENPLVKIELSDRTRDKATTLLIPSFIHGHTNEIMDVLIESQIRANDEQRNTLESQIFFALQSVLVAKVNLLEKEIKETDGLRKIDAETINKRILAVIKGISINEITEEFNKDIERRENIILTDKTRFKTRTIGTQIRNMSFKTVPGNGNKSYLQTKDFLSAYRSCVNAFGSRYDVDSGFDDKVN